MTRRQLLLPTLRGWCVLAALAIVAFTVFLKGAYPFLSPNSFREGGPLIVECWGTDRLMKEAIRLHDEGHYGPILIPGGSIPSGQVFSQYHTLGEFSAAEIKALSNGRVRAEAIVVPDVQKDRTFACAMGAREWLEAHGGIPANVTVLSAGPHSRRSWLLYRKAFGKTTNVGIIATTPDDYDPARWWASNDGFRVVVGEFIAYAYARLMFWRSGA